MFSGVSCDGEEDIISSLYLALIKNLGRESLVGFNISMPVCFISRLEKIHLAFIF